MVKTIRDSSILTSSRREQLLDAGARLFAERGFHGVSIEELGSAVGIRGPAIYKHFSGKDEVLAEMLVGISRHLLEKGQDEVRNSRRPRDSLCRLIQFHTDFALASPHLIRVHDRDLANLSVVEARKVRRLQRVYVELWVDNLAEVDRRLNRDEAQTKVHAVFGLLNSTPHSAVKRSKEVVRPILIQMATAALGL